MMQKSIIRLRVKTNKLINLMVAIENEKTIRELAHRVLICFHQLAEQHVQTPPKRRQLTVTGIKVDNFFISKDEIVGNLLKDNDQIDCILAKSKPKFPFAPNSYQNSIKGLIKFEDQGQGRWKETDQKKQKEIIKERLKEKKQKKREKILQKKKQRQEQKNKIQLFEEARKTAQSCNDPQIEGSSHKELLGQTFKTNQIKISYDIQQDNQRTKFQKGTINIEENEKPYNGYQEQQAQQNLSIDTTLTIEHKGQMEQNDTIENRKDLNFGKKSITTTSILDILSRAADEKGRRNKKKEKKGIVEDKNQAKDQASSVLILPKCSKQDKQKQGASINKIASPKVTFHNSPMLSPQALNINSPKRKASNPCLQKIELESLYEGGNERKGKKIVSPEVKTIETMKGKGEGLSSKIIVEQDSEAQSGVVEKTVEQPKQLEIWKNPKVAALNQKINKYKLQFFNENSDDQ